MTLSNEFMTEAARALAAEANEALRTEDYGPWMLNCTCTFVEQDDGSVKAAWKANMGDFSTHPRTYDTAEEALKGLSIAIKKSAEAE